MLQQSFRSFYIVGKHSGVNNFLHQPDSVPHSVGFARSCVADVKDIEIWVDVVRAVWQPDAPTDRGSESGITTPHMPHVGRFVQGGVG